MKEITSQGAGLPRNRAPLSRASRAGAYCPPKYDRWGRILANPQPDRHEGVRPTCERPKITLTISSDIGVEVSIVNLSANPGPTSSSNRGTSCPQPGTVAPVTGRVTVSAQCTNSEHFTISGTREASFTLRGVNGEASRRGRALGPQPGR